MKTFSYIPSLCSVENDQSDLLRDGSAGAGYFDGSDPFVHQSLTVHHLFRHDHHHHEKDPWVEASRDCRQNDYLYSSPLSPGGSFPHVCFGKVRGACRALWRCCILLDLWVCLKSVVLMLMTRQKAD